MRLTDYVNAGKEWEQQNRNSDDGFRRINPLLNTKPSSEKLLTVSDLKKLTEAKFDEVIAKINTKLIQNLDSKSIIIYSTDYPNLNLGDDYLLGKLREVGYIANLTEDGDLSIRW